MMILLNNKFVQTQLISDYLKNHLIFNKSKILIGDFDYKVFEKRINSDIILVNEQQAKIDTVFTLYNAVISINLMDILLSRDIIIDQIQIDSLLLNLSESDLDDNNNFEYVMSKIFSIHKNVAIKKISIDNLSVNHNQYHIENIRLNIDKFHINSDSVDIVNVNLYNSKNSINANCNFSKNLIKIDVHDSYFQNLNLFSFKSDFLNLLNSQKIDFSSTILINKDSINGSSFVKYKNSNLDLEFVKNINDFNFNYKSNLKLDDFSSELSYFNNIDSLQLSGNIDINQLDFIICNGLIDSEYGKIEFEVYETNTKEFDYKCNLVNIDLGKLTDQPRFGKFNGNFNFNSINNKFSNFHSNINSLSFNGYDYHNISVKENILEDNLVDYIIDINDHNLNLSSIFTIQSKKYNDHIAYNSNFSGIINNIDLNKLNYNIGDSINSMSTEFFIDNIDLIKYIGKSTSLKFNNPYLQLKNISYTKNRSINLIEYVNFKFVDNMTSVHMESDLGIGQFDIFNNNLFNLFSEQANISFLLNLDLSKASVFSDLLMNNVVLNNDFYCSINYLNGELPIIKLKTPGLTFSKIQFKNIDINSSNKSFMDFKIDKILFSDNISLENFILSAEWNYESENIFHISYLSEENNNSSLKGKFIFNKNYINFDFDPESIIHFSNQKWNLDNNSKIVLNSKKINFNNFSINSSNQNLKLSGWINNEPYINFSFNNFQLDYLNPLLKKDKLLLDGIVDGDVFYNSKSFPVISGDFKVEDFTLNNNVLGKLILNNYSNANNDSLFTSGVIKDSNDIMNFLLKYPLDGTKDIHADISLNKFPAKVIDTFLNPISNLNGQINGDLVVHGPIDNYHIFGTTILDKINFNIPYLGTKYSSNNNSMLVKFNQDSIIIDDFNFYDTKNSTSAIFKGQIKHSALKDMSYDLVINSDSLYALNTSQFDNENYYGDIFLNGNMTIKGAPEKINLHIEGKSKEGTSIMIPLLQSKEIQENQFFQFVNNSSDTLELYKPIFKKPEFNMDFNLSIDNQSEIQLIFDKELGDLMRGFGEGDLLLQINKEGDFEIFGDFEIEKGNYLFTLQDVITKSFEIERGGIINFNGNIEKARVDLNVLYNVQASLYPLNSNYDRNQKSPIVCRMHMYGPLLKPEINFSIDILNPDQVAETTLETITNTDQKLLEQFLYLLIANSFLIENDPTVDYLSNTLATTGTELLSNQLSNWLSQTTDAFDLGFKWVPGTTDSLSYQQVELAVSKKFLDNRVIVNGNVGTPPEQSEATIIGDLDIEYDFFKDGRFKLRVFNRAEDYDPLSESLGYEQGIGVFFKKQFDSFPELFIIEKNE